MSATASRFPEKLSTASGSYTPLTPRIPTTPLTRVTLIDEQDDYDDDDDEHYSNYGPYDESPEALLPPVYQEIRDLKQRIWKLKLWIRTILGLVFPGAALLLFLLSANVVRVQQLAPKAVVPSPAPLIPEAKKTFELDPVFAAPPSPASDAAWDSLMPQGRGFVYVHDWESFHLPRGQDTKHGMIYSISMYHQLHCLTQIRKAHGSLALGLSLGSDDDHIQECFDYLRQSLLCNGDMSVEWPTKTASGHSAHIDGWGVPHTCKNYDDIMLYMDTNGYNYSTNSFAV